VLLYAIFFSLSSEFISSIIEPSRNAIFPDILNLQLL
jgi:hypothetical protein